VEHHPPVEELVCPCCGEQKKCIGEEVSEEVERIPASFKVWEHARLKYACPRCQEGVTRGPAAERVVEKARPGASVVAEVLDAKFGVHLPLYRQAEMFQRQGWDVSRATLCSWVGLGAERLRPVFDYLKVEVRKSLKLHTDDTPVRVLEPGLGKTRWARFWVYVGDEEHPYDVFDYTRSRSRDGPARFLDGYKGFLQADAFAGYDALYAGREIIEAACWAHTRRKFFEAQETAPLAVQMVGLIRELYAVEELGRQLDAAGRQKLRGVRSRPVLDRIHVWLETQKREALPKSPLGLAIHYALANWAALERFVEHGILEIDNNAAENALRRIALGRKNWLFMGNDAAGERAAIIYTLIGSCRRHGVDTWLYLKDLLLRVNSHPASRIAELAPQNWQRIILPTLAGPDKA
jgi:transposase